MLKIALGPISKLSIRFHGEAYGSSKVSFCRSSIAAILCRPVMILIFDVYCQISFPGGSASNFKKGMRDSPPALIQLRDGFRSTNGSPESGLYFFQSK